MPCTLVTNCTKDEPSGAASAQTLGTPSTTLSTFCPELLPWVGRGAPLAGSGQCVLTRKQALRGLSCVFGDEATPGALKAPCELEPSLPHPSHVVPPRGQRLSFRGSGWTSTRPDAQRAMDSTSPLSLRDADAPPL